MIVVSGAPATGKSTVAAVVADRLGFPLLSLDTIKEALADVLGVKDEGWSNLLGDTAAEVVFRLSAAFPAVVVEGWWRDERRRRAEQQFAGCVEIFCRCEPAVAEQRMRARRGLDRHSIHRDTTNPAVIQQAGLLARTVRPLGVGVGLIQVDTTSTVAWDCLVGAVRDAFSSARPTQRTPSRSARISPLHSARRSCPARAREMAA